MMEREPNAVIDRIMQEHAEIKAQLDFLKGQIKDTGDDANRAHEKIRRLEERMDEIGDEITTLTKEMSEVKNEVKSFGPRQEEFLQNTWSLIFNLVKLVGLFLVILGGLVGVKVAFPLFGQ